MKDLMNRVNPRRAIAPVVVTNSNAAQVGQIIDRQGFESLTLLIMLGALGAGTSGAVSIEHGDDPALADTAPVGVNDLIGTLALASFVAADANGCKKVGYIGSKRYIRVTVTPAGNGAASIAFAVAALMGHANMVPTTNPPA